MDATREEDPLLASYDSELTDFLKWTPTELTTYLTRVGVPVNDIFIKHQISGDIISLLTDADYQRMGIESVGDCLRLKKAVSVLQCKAKVAIRSVTVWEADEYVVPNVYEYALCHDCCSYDTDKYKLTNSTLQLTTKSSAYCCCNFIGPLQGYLASAMRKWSGSQYRVESIPLTSIRDVSIVTQTPSYFQECCGIKGQDLIVVTYSTSDAYFASEIEMQRIGRSIGAGNGRSGGISSDDGSRSPISPGGGSMDSAHSTSSAFRTHVLSLEQGTGARVLQLMREVMAENYPAIGGGDVRILSR